MDARWWCSDAAAALLGCCYLSRHAGRGHVAAGSLVVCCCYVFLWLALALSDFNGDFIGPCPGIEAPVLVHV